MNFEEIYHYFVSFLQNDLVTEISKHVTQTTDNYVGRRKID